MAAYPSSIFFPLPAQVVNDITLVMAEHINDLRAEMVAVETIVGVTPNRSVAALPDAISGEDFFVDGRVFETLTERIANIERAAWRDFDSKYVKLSGGSIINPINVGGGLGILPGNGTFAELEILSAGQGWAAGVPSRSKIKLWSSGQIEGTRVELATGAGHIFIDPSLERFLDAGTSYLSHNGLSIGAGKLYVDTSGATADALRLTVPDAANTGVKITLGANSVAASALTVVKGVATVLDVSPDGSLSVGNSIDLDASTNTVTVGSTVLDEDSLSLSGNTSLTSETLTIGSTISLSGKRLQLSTAELFVTANNDYTYLRAAPNHKLAIGMAGTNPNGHTNEFKQVLVVEENGTWITGRLNLADNVTTVWPNRSDEQRVVWMDTHPKIGGYSQLDPTYWWDFKEGPGDGYATADTGFEFVAPASGWVKITLQGEVYGNVSRSAVSYEIQDITAPHSRQNPGQALGPGPGHAIAFNAPIAEQVSDFFYTNLSNVYCTQLTPGRTYYLHLVNQRAVPGADAAGPYFPWHENYSTTYPWGRWFPAKYLRVYVEPNFSVDVRSTS